MRKNLPFKLSIALRLILAIALIEFVIMLFFSRLTSLEANPILKAVLDTLILSICVIIASYHILNKPMRSLKSQLVSKDYVESIFNNMLESVIVIDPKGLIKTVNKATTDLLGYKEEDLLDRPAEDLFEEEEILNEIEGEACLLSRDFKILKANNALLTRLGRTKKDVLNQPCYKVTHNRDAICEAPHDICPVKAVMNKNEPCVELHTHFDNKGNKFLVNVIAAPVKGKTGDVVYYLHLSRKLKEGEDLAKDVQRTGELAHKLEIYINRLEEQRIFSEGALEALSRLGAVKNAELYYKTKTGEKIPISFSGSITKDESGKPIGIIIVARDMREVRRLEEQLLRSKKLAAIGELAAGVAHEINNPLNVISGNAEILSMETRDREVKEAADVIIKQVKRTAEITKRLLQFSRKIRSKIQTVDINKILEEAVILLSYQVKLENIKISKELSPGSLETMGDPVQLQEVFLNIMVNAVQAMPKGGELSLSTYTEKIVDFGKRKTDPFKQGSEVIVIEFKDTGEGIAENSLSEIFDPFVSTKDDGTGLGLSICHGIIDTHQGTIDVRSKIGEGATFTIRLPRGGL